MADIQRKVQQYGQKLVSGDKYRYRADGFDLDLTYIFPRLIAMGIPGEGIERNWRNDIKEVSRFLNEKHGPNYLIFNLTGEKYDYKKFNNQVNEEFDFPDHHPPCMSKFLAAIKAIDRWIAADASHVAVVHCLAGRSRTGCVVAGYLLYAGITGSNQWEPPFLKADHAIEYFNSARSSEGQNIVLPSQVRWVHYLEKVLTEKKENEILHNPAPLVLQSIRVIPTPLVEGGTSTFSIAKSTTGGAWTPLIQILPLAESTTDARPALLQKVYAQIWADDPPRILSAGALLKGDVEIIISHSAKNATHFSKTLSRLYSAMQIVQLAAKFPKIPLFRYIFHTSFIQDNRLILRAPDLDAPLAGPVNTSSHISRDLVLELIFDRPLAQHVQSNPLDSRGALPPTPSPASPRSAPPPTRPSGPLPTGEPTTASRLPTMNVQASGISSAVQSGANSNGKMVSQRDGYEIAPGMVVLAAVHGNEQPSSGMIKASPRLSPQTSPKVSPRSPGGLSPGRQRTASYGMTPAPAPIEVLERPPAFTSLGHSVTQGHHEINYATAPSPTTSPGRPYNPYAYPFHSAPLNYSTNPFLKPQARSSSNLTPAQAAVAAVQGRSSTSSHYYPQVLPQQDPRAHSPQNARKFHADYAESHYGANAYVYSQEGPYQAPGYPAYDVGQAYVDPDMPSAGGYDPYAQYPQYQHLPHYPTNGELQPPPDYYYY